MNPQENLLPGLHLVRISRISEGANIFSTLFNEIRFENDHGFIDKIIYHDFIKNLYLLFKTCYIDFLDFEYLEKFKWHLLGQELYIEVLDSYEIILGDRYLKIGNFISLKNEIFYYPEEPNSFTSQVWRLKSEFKNSLFIESSSESSVMKLDDFSLNPEFYDGDEEFLSYLLTGCSSSESYFELLNFEEEMKAARENEEWHEEQLRLENSYADKYSQFGGSYGLKDNTINVAFEGNPEWYWNVD